MKQNCSGLLKDIISNSQLATSCGYLMLIPMIHNHTLKCYITTKDLQKGRGCGFLQR